MTISSNNKLAGWGVWLLAIRPRTLPAAVAPVVVGTALALMDQSFQGLPAAAALTGALLLQIGVNLANDYFDCRKGIDTAERLGPIRVTQCGLIPPRRVKAAMIAVLTLAAAVGLYLTAVAGYPLLWIGLLCIVSALAYSGGPFPLASHGLGDLFVFIFFGLVAVCGTYYVQALRLTALAVWSAVPVGLLITAIMAVNNLRDIDTDRRSGKYTLAVILGRRGAQIEYALLLAGAYLIPACMWFKAMVGAEILLTLFSLPLAGSLVMSVWQSHGRALNRILARTAILALLYSGLFAAGLLWRS